MNHSITVRVFVVGPRDVDREKRVVQKIADELNASWPRGFGVHLDIISEDTHTASGIGKYGQEVINKQVADDYDVLLGIMGQRFGTATQKARSGTEEEFRRALRRYKKNKKEVDIQFYFKDVPVHPSTINLAQLAQVRKFQSTVAKSGVFYKSFKKPAAFHASLRFALMRLLESRSGSSPRRVGGKRVVLTLDDDLAQALRSRGLRDDQLRRILPLWIENFSEAVLSPGKSRVLKKDADVQLSSLLGQLLKPSAEVVKARRSPHRKPPSKRRR